MFDPARWSPGDGALELLLLVSLGVFATSGAAWFASRHLADAALRHLVLFGGLVSCLAIPATASVGAAAGLTLISIPVFGGGRHGTVLDESGKGADPACACTPSCRPAGPFPANAFLPDPGPRATERSDQTEQVTGVAARANTPAAVRSFAPPMPASFRRSVAAASFVWAAGASLMLARLVRDCGRVVRFRRSSRPVRAGRLHTLMREVADRLGMRPAPELLLSNRDVSPVAVGFGRPAVVLSERLLGGIGEDGLRDVLVHEVAHLRRGDQRIVLLQGLAAALYWPIVPVHGLNRALRRTREELCDDAVLAGRDAISYGETLLRVAELFVKPRPTNAAVGMAGGRGELERRIAGLIGPKSRASATAGRVRACVAAGLFVAASVVPAGTRFVAPAGAAAPAGFASAVGPLRNLPAAATGPSAAETGREPIAKSIAKSIAKADPTAETNIGSNPKVTCSP